MLAHVPKGMLVAEMFIYLYILINPLIEPESINSVLFVYVE
jgi:hypothetical protein